MISRPGKTNVGRDDVPDVSGDDYPDDDDSSDDGDSTPLEFDDGPWEAFLPDDEQFDPLPEPGDFWIESDQSRFAFVGSSSLWLRTYPRTCREPPSVAFRA